MASELPPAGKLTIKRIERLGQLDWAEAGIVAELRVSPAPRART